MQCRGQQLRQNWWTRNLSVRLAGAVALIQNKDLSLDGDDANESAQLARWNIKPKTNVSKLAVHIFWIQNTVASLLANTAIFKVVER